MARAGDGLPSGIRQALAFLAQNDFQDFAPGKIDLIPDKLFCLLQEMDSVPFAEARPESHRQFIDIQYLISGHERMGVSRVESGLHTVVDDRTPQQDICSGRLKKKRRR
jgi:YhcH/YjgK/YiaL family protein